MVNIQLVDILESINHSEFVGDSSCSICEAKSITDNLFSKSCISWVSDKNIDLISQLSSATVVISKLAYSKIQSEKLSNDINLIVVENPRKTFAKILTEFFAKKPNYGNVCSSAKIHKSVSIDITKVSIGSNVVIEENCEIGEFVTIEHNSVIKSDTKIKNHISIGSNCTIGGFGFGYEPNEDGSYEAIPHIGNVVLSDYVEIGNNVCIDRAVMGSTFLSNNVKVDNLVHIAHGVHIEENSLIIANAMIAGSVNIGKNCWISPSSSIIQKVTIGDNSIVGIGSVVLKNVDDNSTVVGVPAKKLAKN
jgi:UDP-3-O-[3-hydroxymyristoyl] glucosamine N-acyltransferase